MAVPRTLPGLPGAPQVPTPAFLFRHCADGERPDDHPELLATV